MSQQQIYASTTSQGYDPFAKALMETNSNSFHIDGKLPDSPTQALAGITQGEESGIDDRPKASQLEQPTKKEIFQRVPRLNNLTEENKFPIYQAKQSREQELIEEIRRKLGKLISESVGNLNRDVNQATSQNVSDVGSGVYHRNFFDRLRIIITSLIEESAKNAKTWLQHSQSKKNGSKMGPTLGLITSGREAYSQTANSWSNNELNSSRNAG